MSRTDDRKRSLARVREVQAELREENDRAEWRKFYASQLLERNGWPRTWMTLDPPDENPRVQAILRSKLNRSTQSGVLTSTTATSYSSTSAVIKLKPGP